jgi:hypothetical protein
MMRMSLSRRRVSIISLLCVAVLLCGLLVVDAAFAGLEIEDLGIGTCAVSPPAINCDDHCPDCGPYVHAYKKFAYNAIAVEPYYELCDLVPGEAICRNGYAVDRDYKLKRTIGISYQESHSWGESVGVSIALKVMGLSDTLNHSNSLSQGCSLDESLEIRQTLNFSFPAGQEGYYTYRYQMWGTDYQGLLYWEHVNGCPPNHSVIHYSQNETVRYRLKTLTTSTGPWTCENSKCALCNASFGGCNGHNCPTTTCCHHSGD